MRTLLLLSLVLSATVAQVFVQNSLADLEVINKPKADKYIRKCEIKGKPLDLMYIVDSSGSVGPQWQQTLQVLKDLTNFVTIAPDGSATRISFLLFAKFAKNVFDFNTYYRREEIVARMNQIQPINGVTNTGNAFNESLNFFTAERGMRGPSVPKVIFLFSDGRASDGPKDIEMARILREQYNIQIFAFGLGEYLDYGGLTQIVGGDRDKIANSKQLQRIFEWFQPWKGIEICEEVPACVPGSHKPLDLMFVVDTSSSVEDSFQQSINFVQTLVNVVNVHPQAVQVALITYASHPDLVFQFNELKSNEEVSKALLNVKPQRGVTKTSEALKLAADTFDPLFGARDGVRRLAVVVTDGHADRSPKVWAKRLIGLKNVEIFAIGLEPETVDVRELMEVTDNREDHIYIGGRNLIELQKDLLDYADLLCPGIEGLDGPLSLDDYEKHYLEPYIPKCNADGLVVDVRTKNPMEGVIYAIGYENKIDCQAEGQSETKTQVIIKRGSCGMKIEPTEQGYKFNLRLGIRYHTYVDTGADETFDVSCEVFEPYNLALEALNDPIIDLDNNLLNAAKIDDATCDYKVRSSQQSCEMLDAKVGTKLSHEWKCAMPPNHRFLVHDCVIVGGNNEVTPLNMLSNEGCQIDEVLLQTPKYDPKAPNMVTQASYAFKFPQSESVQYQCLISICDMNDVLECKYMLERQRVSGPIACRNEGPLYEAARINSSPINYDDPPQHPRFAKTVTVKSRIVNIYQKADFVRTRKSKSKAPAFCTTIN